MKRPFETHVNKVGLSLRSEVPLHRGGAVHLAALLTGDAAQLEALSRHRLGVRVHFCTGSVATVHCPTMKNNQNRLQDVAVQTHADAGSTDVCHQEVAVQIFCSLQGTGQTLLQGFYGDALPRQDSLVLLHIYNWKEESQLTEEGAEQRHEQQLHPHRSLGNLFMPQKPQSPKNQQVQKPDPAKPAGRCAQQLPFLADVHGDASVRKVQMRGGRGVCDAFGAGAVAQRDGRHRGMWLPRTRPPSATPHPPKRPGIPAPGPGLRRLTQILKASSLPPHPETSVSPSAPTRTLHVRACARARVCNSPLALQRTGALVPSQPVVTLNVRAIDPRSGHTHAVFRRDGASEALSCAR